MTATAGRWIVGAALIVVAIVVILATCEHDDEPPPAAPVVAASPTSQESRDVAKPKIPRATRVVAADTPPAETTNVAPDADEWPTLDVEVIHADGTPARHAWVYIRPPGSPGRSSFGDGSGPTGKTGDDGRCRLLLPRRGAVDVGVVSGPESVVVPDVVVPRETLRIDLPRLEEIQFVATPAAAERIRRNGATVWMRPPGSGPWHTFPGRDERLGGWFAPDFLANTLTARLLVPADLDWAVAVSPDLRATPTALRTPARVELAETGAVRMAIDAKFAAMAGAAAPLGDVHVEFDIVPQLESATAVLNARLGYEPDDLAPSHETEIWLPPSGGRLRWHGSGVASGQRTITASDVAAASVDIVVQLDGSRLATERSNVTVDVLFADAPAPRELALAPGGFLVVECATKPPAELGRLTLQRKDGAPLTLMAIDRLTRVDVITGKKIGPLPPGDHTFVLRLAGFDVGEVTATVVAGETTKLVVPHVPAR